MSKPITLNVHVSGALREFVADNVGEDGVYENVSEYVRDLIRRDMERADQVNFERAFVPLIDVEDVIRRGRERLARSR